MKPFNLGLALSGIESPAIIEDITKLNPEEGNNTSKLSPSPRVLTEERKSVLETFLKNSNKTFNLFK